MAGDSTPNQPIDPHQRSDVRGYEFWTLVAITVAAAVLRCYGLQSQSLTSDEVVELQIASQSPMEIVRNPDGFPPLYYLVLHGLLGISESDMAGRWLSALFGIAAIPVVACFARCIGGTRSGIMAAVLLAIHPTHVYFSQEGRSYALYFLLSAIALWRFYRAVETDRHGDWGWFALSAGIAAYAHYYVAFLLVTLGMIYLWRWYQRQLTYFGLVAFFAAGMLQVPLVFIALYDLDCGQVFLSRSSTGFEAVAFTGWSLVVGFCLGPSLRELHSLDLVTAFREMVPWLTLLAVAFVLLIWRWVRLFDRRIGELALLVLLPIALAFGATHALGIAYNVRYVFVCVAPLVVLIALALTSSPRSPSMVLAGTILIALSLSSIAHRQFDSRYHNEDSYAAMQHLAEFSPNSGHIFTMSSYMELPVGHYLPGKDWQVTPLADIGADGAGLADAIALLVEHCDGQSTSWLFYSRAFHGDPQRLLIKDLTEREALRPTGTWPGVKLFEVDCSKLKPSPEDAPLPG